MDRIDMQLARRRLTLIVPQDCDIFPKSHPFGLVSLNQINVDHDYIFGEFLSFSSPYN